MRRSLLPLLVAACGGHEPADIDAAADAAPPGWFVVDSEDDAVDVSPGDGVCATAAGACSLRAAVQEANARAGADGIELPAGVHRLTLADPFEDDAATGDLDVTGELIIAGAAEASAIIEGDGGDRVFDVLAASLRLENLTVRGGVAPQADAGGCVQTAAATRLELDHVTVRDGRAVTGGGLAIGGIAEGADVTVRGCEGMQGGGIAVEGDGSSLTLRRADIRDNTAHDGAGIHTRAEFDGSEHSALTLDQSTVRDNVAAALGGGVHGNSGTAIVIRDSTLTGNRAGGGGAIFNDGGCTFDIRGSTITGNHASNQGGGIAEVHFVAQFITLRNSILAGNTSDGDAPNCHRNLGSAGGTLFGAAGTCMIESDPTDLLDTDPQLGPLVELPGRGAYFVPAPGSPAIDAGVDASCTEVDQSGAPRPHGAHCDIGSAER